MERGEPRWGNEVLLADAKSLLGRHHPTLFFINTGDNNNTPRRSWRVSGNFTAILLFSI